MSAAPVRSRHALRTLILLFAQLAVLAPLTADAVAQPPAGRLVDVELISPSPQRPAVVASDATTTVTFTATRPWPYVLEARPAGDERAWTALAEGRAALGDNAVEVAVGSLDLDVYDLRVRIGVPAAAHERVHDRLGDRLADRGDRDTVTAALQVAPSELPTTAFEDDGGQTSTPIPDEYAFLDAVVAASPRVAMTEIGESTQGRPLHLVRIGYPRPPVDADIAVGPTLLLIGSQHGDEPAGREMSLQLLRDLAFTDDPELVAQLRQLTVLVVPTANPDGRVADTRGNATGVDINRDHLNLTTPEGRAFGRVLRDFTPEITVDAHEGPSTPNNPGQIPRLELSWPRNLNVDDEIGALSRQLVEDHVFPAIEAAGYPTDVYGSPGGAGGGDARILRNALGLRHGPGMLIETFNATPSARVELQLRTLHEVLRFEREHRDEIVSAVAAAPARAADEGAAQVAPVFLGGSDWEPPDDDDVLDPPPCGYLLNTVQAEALSVHAALFPLQLEQVSEQGVFVPMGQPLKTVVPLLVDERAASAEVEGRPLQDCSDPGSVEPPEPPPPPSPPAQHVTDFSDAVPGQVPEGWTPVWMPSDWTVLDEPRVLRHVVDDRGGRRALVWDEPGIVVGDVELYTLVRADSANTMFQLPLHVSGEAGSENAYYLDARVDQSALRINRYVDGTFSTIGRADFEPQQDTWYRLRFRREGDRLLAKVWEDGDPEPDWQASAVDRSLTSGAVGFAGFQTNSVNDWAFLGVGVGGEPAPGPEG